MKQRKKILSIIAGIIIAVLLCGCTRSITEERVQVVLKEPFEIRNPFLDLLSPEELAKQDEYKEWIDKFFKFDYQGSEAIEYQYIGKNDTMVARITLPYHDQAAFLERQVQFALAFSETPFTFDDVIDQIIWEYPTSMIAQADITEEDFQFALYSDSAAYFPEDGFCVTRYHYVVVLKPAAGITTIYAVVNFMHYEYE